MVLIGEVILLARQVVLRLAVKKKTKGKNTFDEYFRFKEDTLNFIVPGEDYLIGHGCRFAEQGDLDNATLIFKAVISEFPESYQAYEGLGDTYLKKGDTEQAIHSFKKSVELNPQNTTAIEMLKKLENK